MIVTQWFNNVNPKYIGVYERLVFTGLEYIITYSYWEGCYWGRASYTVEGAKLNRNILSINQSSSWRGIASICQPHH